LAYFVLASFKHYVADVHCKYIIFGAPGDNGYARLLGPYSQEEAVRKRITMLQGPPFAQELAALTKKFAVTSFPDVFRDSKLPTRRVSFSLTPPTSPGPKNPTYATAASQSNRSPSAEPSALTEWQAIPSSQPRRLESRVLKNSKGERIDPLPQQPLNETLLACVKEQKFCNLHHLNNDCPYKSAGSNCIYVHGKLTSLQLEAQRYIARLTICYAGLACEDEKCVRGHHCPKPGCRGIGCNWPMELHNVSRE
jgi:hypothetical protein